MLQWQGDKLLSDGVAIRFIVWTVYKIVEKIITRGDDSGNRQYWYSGINFNSDSGTNYFWP
ncbi:hypothetical protein GCM10008983_22470 [Lentibacillus halophilus]|uniref:Uncharacterized protein n=1 Tax=Lentibacillus halophilus TaxID=295065 RepID=A0ABP3J7H2_9BACI